MKERTEKMEDDPETNLYQQKEDGVEISGGEAQKLSIARALYKDAPIVIMDESTAALDPVSEYEIYSHFGQRTRPASISPLPRMSSCRFCDLILVFDAGAIIQAGTHEELLNQKRYAQFWQA